MTAADPRRLILRGRIDRKDDKTGQPRGVKFEGQLQTIAQGGAVSGKDGQIAVERADSLVLLVAAATDFHGGDPEALCRATLAAAAKKSYDALRAAHVAEHQRLFRRVWNSTWARPPRRSANSRPTSGWTASRRAARTRAWWPCISSSGGTS